MTLVIVCSWFVLTILTINWHNKDNHDTTMKQRKACKICVGLFHRWHQQHNMLQALVFQRRRSSWVTCMPVESLIAVVFVSVSAQCCSVSSCATLFADVHVTIVASVLCCWLHVIRSCHFDFLFNALYVRYHSSSYPRLANCCFFAGQLSWEVCK